jgi:hypothetical protein
MFNRFILPAPVPAFSSKQCRQEGKVLGIRG